MHIGTQWNLPGEYVEDCNRRDAQDCFFFKVTENKNLARYAIYGDWVIYIVEQLWVEDECVDLEIKAFEFQ